MRLPSVTALMVQLRDVLIRFPWVVAAGVISAAAALVLVGTPDEAVWTRILGAAALGLPLGTALTLTAEARGIGGTPKTLLLALGALLLAGFYLVWPGPTTDYHALHYVQLSVALHLAAAFLPWLGRANRAGFWQYNRRLLETFVRAGVFSAALFLGLVIVLVALDNLFGVHVPERAYARLWVVMAFLVNTLIFLGGVPRRLEDLSEDRDYPRILKVFAQYVLAPLVTVYLTLLTAYLVKIVVSGDWPSGWVGYLVSSVAVAGILGFLLLAPWRDAPEESWVRTYARVLFIGLIPSSLMFLVALWKRIEPYGLTELRTLGLVLGLWLLGAAVYYSVRPRGEIRIIPVSLCLVLLVTLAGPTGTTAWSLRSQTARLSRHLQVSDDSAGAEAAGALRFLLEHNAADRIRVAFGGQVPGVDTLPRITNANRDSVARTILQAAGIQVRGSTASWVATAFSFGRAEIPVVETRGYRYVLRVEDSRDWHLPGGDSLRVERDTARAALAVLSQGSPVLRFELDSLVAALAASQVPGAPVPVIAPGTSIVASGTGWKGEFLPEWISGERELDGLRVENIRGVLLLDPVPEGR